ncbi:MAG: hypothetical protein ACD_41C00121G0001, partial [uncultured bacterium]
MTTCLAHVKQHWLWWLGCLLAAIGLGSVA